MLAAALLRQKRNDLVAIVSGTNELRGFEEHIPSAGKADRSLGFGRHIGAAFQHVAEAGGGVEWAAIGDQGQRSAFLLEVLPYQSAFDFGGKPRD